MQFRGKVHQTGQKTALRRKKYAQPEFATGDYLPTIILDCAQICAKSSKTGMKNDNRSPAAEIVFRGAARLIKIKSI